MKTPQDVSDAIKKLEPSDQVLVQTFIAKLKSTINDFEAETHEDEEDGHAHFHGHEKCTAEHEHDTHEHDTHEHD